MTLVVTVRFVLNLYHVIFDLDKIIILYTWTNLCAVSFFFFCFHGLGTLVLLLMGSWINFNSTLPFRAWLSYLHFARLPDNSFFSKSTFQCDLYFGHRFHPIFRINNPAWLSVFSHVYYWLSTIIIIGDLGDGGAGAGIDDSAASLYDGGEPGGLNNTGGWWNMMNGGIYEESPPPPPSVPPLPLTHIKTSPSSTPVTTSNTSSTSPSSVTSNSGPLHIPALPAKRLLGYNSDCESAGVIRSSHHASQPWGYGEHPAATFDQYNPTYYNLASDVARDRKGSSGLTFWNPAAGNTPDYPKYTTSTTASSSQDPAFSTGAWCNNYPPYPSAASRHHIESHHYHPHSQPVSYLSPPDEKSRMLTETPTSFSHESYPLRNYPPPPETAVSTPYTTPGTCLHDSKLF